VSNGVNKDLISGLPSQMVEIHEPIRLMLLIEQEPHLISEVLKRKHSLFEWVENQWVRLAAYSPKTKEISIWIKGAWTSLKTEKVPPPPRISGNILAIAKNRETLPVSTLSDNSASEISQ
jgi:uncharacterized protein YbcC (UPF0753/DUF2309 family)